MFYLINTQCCVFYIYLDTYDDDAVKEKELFLSASASESECGGSYRPLKKQKTTNNTQYESDSNKFLTELQNMY